ncbi:MAG: hypothetical protein IJI67_05365 [Clostridia bacterium]|nr:hypothetical protein [Clostridia bacterium]
MRVRGYGVRPPNHGYSGQHHSGDAYNRDYKKVRYTRAEEYATRDVQEYHHYPDQKDLTKDDDDKHLDESQEKSNKQKNKSKSRIKNIQTVMVALAGAAVITVSYQSAMAKKAAQQTDDPGNSVGQDADKAGKDTAASVSWEWSDDFTKAVLVLKDSEGNEIARVDAKVISTEQEAKCTVPGKIIYTATAKAEDKTYTDTREKETPALGHTFDAGTATTTESGEPATDFTCERCGEHFIIQNTLEEE